MRLQGKKTYIFAGLMAATVLARGAGLIDEQTYETCYSLLGALALGALRAGVNKTADPAPAPAAEEAAAKGG